MPTKIFRLNKFLRHITLILGIVLIGFLLWVTYEFIESLLSLGQEYKVIWRIFPIIAVLFGVPLLILVYAIWHIWSYRIEFLETELHLTSRWHPFKRYDRCLYENINYIRRPTIRGLIQITPKRGKSLQFSALALEGGADRIVEEFEKRIAADKIQPHMRSELKRFSRHDKIHYILLIPGLLLYAILFAPKIILRDVAWETIWEQNLSFVGSIRSFWLDDESIWISYRKPFADNSEIVRIAGEKKETWSIDKDNFYPYIVLTDSKNQPWVFGSDSYYHWATPSWERYQLEGYTLSSFSVPIVINRKYWVIAYQKGENLTFLVRFDLDTGEVTPFYPPEQIIKEEYSIRSIEKSPDNSLYVMVAKPYGSVFFYAVRDGQWERKIELADVEWRKPFIFARVEQYGEPKPILGIKDFVVDKTGQIWVIMQKDDQWSIGRSGSNSITWQWSYIEKGCPLCSSSYDDIIVDTLERVWLSGAYGKKQNPNDQYFITEGRNSDVFLPYWNGTAEQIRRYTNTNSNYQVGFGSNDLRISGDGYIWSANDRVVRINANEQELPPALPEWVTNITDIEKALPIFVVIMIPWIVLIFSWALFIKFNDARYQKTSANL